jgi:plasminogen activator inhibitor 1 RNA-binding protein
LAEPDEPVAVIKKNAVVEKKKAEKPIPLGKVKEEHHPDKNPRHRKPVHGREFDKRSASGFKKEGAKKGSVGKGNWGVLGETGSEKEKNVQKEEVVNDENVVLEEEKEEENLKTLDQYLSEKASSLKADAPVRKANEGTDESQWKNAVLLVKEDEDLVAGKVKF